MTLLNGKNNRKYEISEIQANEEGMKEFLFTLGCYPGETVSIISQLASNLIINVKDARYSIDAHLASAIIVEPQLQAQTAPRLKQELVEQFA
ncbi:MAG: FeoA family protein [Spirochaetales bacterium]|uniref:FeoA family protein n=1 Tax=Candidatus Thalassospirochaeta sargassi TaxID=3119039 RepID=A0AAJ1MM65_9SPIO|nr:FeoA family protein [Spirochaetales bacterium]